MKKAMKLVSLVLAVVMLLGCLDSLLLQVGYHGFDRIHRHGVH